MPPHLLHGPSGLDRDAERLKRRVHDLGRLRLLAAQDAVARLEDAHLGAKSGECLGHLDADRPPAQDRKPARQGGQLEEVLVREVVNVAQAR